MVSTEEHGISFWANTGRIDVQLANGSYQSFFIKVMSRDSGRNMFNAEFESMRAMHDQMPDFVPKPIAWGSYESIPETYFLLSEYREMILELPDPDKFAARLSALHQNSESPNGKFGFHVTTYCGNLPQFTGWENSWETFFAKSMKQALDLEIEAKGYDPEFDRLIPLLFEKVIPRLLRPLESEGRSVKPSLVHGDLWFANSGIDSDTGEPLIFDACCFFAHNECKLPCRQVRDECSKYANIQMSLVSGDLCATGSGSSILRHITHTCRSHRLKRTSTAVSISINCTTSVCTSLREHASKAATEDSTLTYRRCSVTTRRFESSKYTHRTVPDRTWLTKPRRRMLGDLRDLTARYS